MKHKQKKKRLHHYRKLKMDAPDPTPRPNNGKNLREVVNNLREVVGVKDKTPYDALAEVFYKRFANSWSMPIDVDFKIEKAFSNFEGLFRTPEDPSPIRE